MGLKGHAGCCCRLRQQVIDILPTLIKVNSQSVPAWLAVKTAVKILQPERKIENKFFSISMYNCDSAASPSKCLLNSLTVFF